jgi:hypothetical protein
MPSLVLALWLAPQLLLAGHGHWVPDDSAPHCEICVQLASTVPAVDTASALPVALVAASAIEFRTFTAVTYRCVIVACRGPPDFPHPLSRHSTQV